MLVVAFERGVEMSSKLSGAVCGSNGRRVAGMSQRKEEKMFSKLAQSFLGCEWRIVEAAVQGAFDAMNQTNCKVA